MLLLLLLLINDDFIAHELEEAACVGIWVACRDLRNVPLQDPYLVKVLHLFLSVVRLQVVNDCQVVDVLAVR